MGGDEALELLAEEAGLAVDLGKEGASATISITRQPTAQPSGLPP
jgi:hypothetical protein